MAIAELNPTNVNSVIDDNNLVIIDFWAPWCGPCRSFKPIFEAAAEHYQDVTFVACNTQEEQELAAAFRVTSIPTVMVFREGVLLYNQAGLLPRPALDELLDKVKALDMDKIRAELPEKTAASSA